MGFFSKLGGAFKKIGKVALKVAPYAAAAIPGIGPAAAIAIAAAAKAADKKLSGGSWGDALKAGAIGGATGALGGGAIGGLTKKLGTKLAGKAAGTMMKNIPTQNLASMATDKGLAPSMGGLAGVLSKVGQGAKTAQQVMGQLKPMMGGGNRGMMPGGMGGGFMGGFNPRQMGGMQSMGGFNPAAGGMMGPMGVSDRGGMGGSLLAGIMGQRNAMQNPFMPNPYGMMTPPIAEQGNPITDISGQRSDYLPRFGGIAGGMNMGQGLAPRGQAMQRFLGGLGG